MRISSLLASALLLGACPCVVTASMPRPQRKTAAAVIAADDGWSTAEETGDAAYVDHLLLPEYRSIGPDGVSHDKAAILSHTKKGKDSAANKEQAAQWKAAHPMGTTTVIAGDTAILSFYLKPLGAEKGVMSSDVFVYRDGEWHALYSQHSTAGR